MSILFFFNYFLLETRLCEFLLYNQVTQLYIYMHYFYIFFSIMLYHRILNMCCAVSPCCLSMLMSSRTVPGRGAQSCRLASPLQDSAVTGQARGRTPADIAVRDEASWARRASQGWGGSPRLYLNRRPEAATQLGQWKDGQHPCEFQRSTTPSRVVKTTLPALSPPICPRLPPRCPQSPPGTGSQRRRPDGSH